MQLGNALLQVSCSVSIGSAVENTLLLYFRIVCITWLLNLNADYVNHMKAFMNGPLYTDLALEVSKKLGIDAVHVLTAKEVRGCIYVVDWYYGVEDVDIHAQHSVAWGIPGVQL